MTILNAENSKIRESLTESTRKFHNYEDKIEVLPTDKEDLYYIIFYVGKNAIVEFLYNIKSMEQTIHFCLVDLLVPRPNPVNPENLQKYIKECVHAHKQSVLLHKLS